MSTSNVYNIDFGAGKLVPISAAGLLPVGQIVTYEDRANPRLEYVVTGASFDTYGQTCVCEDGHSAEVSGSAINGPGGWELDRRGRILDAEGVAAFLRLAADRKNREAVERAESSLAAAVRREEVRVRLLAEWPQLELAKGSKKSEHALGASNLRKVLAKTWPAVKFSIRSKSFSGGNSIDVSWTDGPTSAVVDRVADQFQKCDFDGMDDSTHYRNGIFPELFGGAKYVKASRHVSREAREALAGEMGFVLTFDVWGCAQGFPDWDEEQRFNRALHARDFLAEPVKEPEPVKRITLSEWDSMNVPERCVALDEGRLISPEEGAALTRRLAARFGQPSTPVHAPVLS